MPQCRYPYQSDHMGAMSGEICLNPMHYTKRSQNHRFFYDQPFLPVPGMPASNGGYALVSGPNQQSAGFGTPRPMSYDSYMGDNPPVAPPEDNLLCLEFQNNTENEMFTKQELL